MMPVLRLDLLAVLLCLTLLLQTLVRLITSPLGKIPGPTYTKFTNLPLKFSVLLGQRIYFIQKLHEQYGPIVRISPVEVAVADLDSTLKIHKVGSGFNKTSWYSKLANSSRDGVFAMSDPKAHGLRRKLFARPFSKTSLRAHWEPVLVEKFNTAVKCINRETTETGQADILKWWTLAATDVSSHLMFGESFRTLEQGKKNDYIKTLEGALMGGYISVELPILARIMRLLPLKATQQIFNVNKFLFDYAGKAVVNARSSSSNANIFSSMLSEAQEGTGTVDDLDVQLEAGNLLVAGTDTTAVTLTYMTWLVLQRPQLRKALENEVQTLPDGYTDADLERLPLLNATIDETLRLYGAASGSLPRLVPASGTSLCGHFIPGGSVVSTQSWTLHRDTQLFGDPQAFDPYRFVPETNLTTTSSLSKTATRTALLPFGHGSRICLGIHLAYMELRHGAACFLRDCGTIELSPLTTAETMTPENYFLIAPKQHQCIVISAKHGGPREAISSRI